jgi:hypothetical protein
MTTTDLGAFLRAGPHEPLVTREQVLEIPCSHCGAQPGEECDTTFPRPALVAGPALRGMRDIHMRRYQDVAHDPR